MTLDDFRKNPEYLLELIEELHSTQKEILTKVNENHDAVMCQKDDCGKRFVSKWALGLVVTIAVGILTVSGFNAYHLYDKIHSNSSSIQENKNQIDTCNKQLEEFKDILGDVKNKMILDRYRIKINTPEGTEQFWFVNKKEGDGGKNKPLVATSPKHQDLDQLPPPAVGIPFAMDVAH